MHESVAARPRAILVGVHLPGVSDVLPADQVRVDQRQPGGANTVLHHHLALIALADVKRRRVDHHQQLRPGVFGQPRRLFKPGVLADQQPDPHGAFALAGFKDANALPRREIAPLVKHLVVGQFTFRVGRDDYALPQHPGGVVALLHGHALGTQSAGRFVALTGVAVGGRTHDHRQAF